MAIFEIDADNFRVIDVASDSEAVPA